MLYCRTGVCFPSLDLSKACYVRSANAVAVITFPPSLLSPSFCKRWQHMADVLLSVRAIPDEDKELGKLPTGYQDMVGFLNVHKIARVNTQVPVILEATTFSIKLQKRRFLVLECLNQAPIDGSSGTSYGTSGGCSVSSKSGAPRFLASLHIDHQASACQTNTESSPGTEQKHCWSLQAEHSRVFIINWPSSAIVEYAVVDNNPALDARKRASLC